MPPRQPSSLSSNSSFPQTSLLYLSSLYSLCRLYEFYAALRESQKKRKDTLQGLSALLCLIAMLGLPGCRNTPPCISFLFTVIHSIHNTYTDPGTCFEQQEKMGTSSSEGRIRFRYFVFIQKKGKLASLRVSSSFLLFAFSFLPAGLDPFLIIDFDIIS